jgi:PTS system nitrogen regulatory IIA component
VQLTVRDVARLLDVSETAVTRWIRDRGLPARPVNGQYRFSRSDLLEWATANRLKVSGELFDGPEADDDEPLPALAEALEAGGIHHDVPAADKQQALRALVERLPLPAGTDRELILRLLAAREAAAATAIGDGIALPHVRNPIVLRVARPTITLCLLARPIEFGALDEKPVHVLFSLIGPTTRTHLQMLARLSHALHDGGFRAAVMHGAPRPEILAAARRADPAAGRPGGASGGGRRSQLD